MVWLFILWYTDKKNKLCCLVMKKRSSTTPSPFPPHLFVVPDEDNQAGADNVVRQYVSNKLSSSAHSLKERWMVAVDAHTATWGPKEWESLDPFALWQKHGPSSPVSHTVHVYEMFEHLNFDRDDNPEKMEVLHHLFKNQKRKVYYHTDEGVDEVSSVSYIFCLGAFFEKAVALFPTTPAPLLHLFKTTTTAELAIDATKRVVQAAAPQHALAVARMCLQANPKVGTAVAEVAARTLNTDLTQLALNNGVGVDEVLSDCQALKTSAATGRYIAQTLLSPPMVKHLNSGDTARHWLRTLVNSSTGLVTIPPETFATFLPSLCKKLKKDANADVVTALAEAIARADPSAMTPYYDVAMASPAQQEFAQWALRVSNDTLLARSSTPRALGPRLLEEKLAERSIHAWRAIDSLVRAGHTVGQEEKIFDGMLEMMEGCGADVGALLRSTLQKKLMSVAVEEPALATPKRKM